MNTKDKVMVVFGEKLPSNWRDFEVGTIVAKEELKQEIEVKGLKFIDISNLIEAGSIYEASAIAEELGNIKLPTGERVSKLFIYKGYELWWMYSNNLYLYFCLPYTQYKKLLAQLENFKEVLFYEPPFKTLFFCYLESRGIKPLIIKKKGIKSPAVLPLGVLVQIIITLISIPILALRKKQIMVFTGDKFETNRDYDFRMKFIYEELRKRKLPFVEFIRSLETWKSVIKNAIVRKRAVVYSEAVSFSGRLISLLFGGRRRAKKEFGPHIFNSESRPDSRFKLYVAIQPLLSIYDDVWTIRIMKLILRSIGVRAGFMAAAIDRNFHAFIGCKLNNVPTVGILHGVASRHYNLYDFLPGFDGDKRISVDKYGVWSDWWREYYTKYSKVYNPEQIFVSGPMRPFKNTKVVLSEDVAQSKGPVKILFVSEQLAVPMEALPYLEALLNEPNTKITIIFRNYRDGFKDWLTLHKPELLKHERLNISIKGLQETIGESDIVVGSHSTAVIEGLLQKKIPIFFQTKKWGDYYSLKDYDPNRTFFAGDPKDFINKIKKAPFVLASTLEDLLERYFGDPHKNGSAWVVDQLEETVLKEKRTK